MRDWADLAGRLTDRPMPFLRGRGRHAGPSRQSGFGRGAQADRNGADAEGPLPDVARIPRIQSSRDSSSRAWIRTAYPRALATLIPRNGNLNPERAGTRSLTIDAGQRVGLAAARRAVSRSPRWRAAGSMGYGKAERRGGLAVHDHLEPGRELHREIARLRAAQNPINISGGATPGVYQVN